MNKDEIIKKAIVRKGLSNLPLLNIKPSLIEGVVKEAIMIAIAEQKDMYTECLENFVPINNRDEANEFLSTYGSGLAKELAKGEK
jgi:hypothetical protein